MTALSPDPAAEAMHDLASHLRDHKNLVRQLQEARARVEQLGCACADSRERVEKARAIVREHLDAALPDEVEP